jgi:hypothetical protein
MFIGDKMQTETLDAAALIDATNTEVLDDVLIRVCDILQLSPAQFSKAEGHYHTI